MANFKVGEFVGLRCEVAPGPFGEMMVTIDTLDGTISGFVRRSELRETGDQWYVRGAVQSIFDDALEVWIRGSFLTTNGLANVPQHIALAA